MKKTFYTDGSCLGNPGPGGWAYVNLEEIEYTYTVSDSDEEFEDTRYFLDVLSTANGQEEKTTNNRMELTAIIKVCELAASDPNNEYIIKTDSAYCVNIINDWMWNWAKNDWHNSKQRVVENLDLVQTLFHYFSTPFFNVTVRKVSGHAGILGNELADKLAKNQIDEYSQIIKENNVILNAIYQYNLINNIKCDIIK